MDTLRKVKKKQQALQTSYLSNRLKDHMRKRYMNAAKRLLLLDYDGTLTGFADTPAAANPDKELYRLIEHLTDDERNDVVIISGRAHSQLGEWFSHLPVYLVGEHGVWFREKNGEWQHLQGLSTDWKESIRTVLDNYNEQIPGAFTEDKTYSLVWHFRKAETELGETRAAELMNTLRYTVADLGLQLLRGNKVVEIKSIEASKGKSALHYRMAKDYDFAITIGDDVSDEDMFSALADKAYTIKVGTSLSAARYYLNDVTDVRNFLKFISSSHLSLDGVISRLKRTLPATFKKLNRKS